METIGITGGSGFVGQHITQKLVALGYEVIIFTRGYGKNSNNKQITYANWEPYKSICDNQAIDKVTAMIHLAGAGVADKRWTTARKQEIVDSRVISTRFLVDTLKKYGKNCKTLISTSGIGCYGEDKSALPFEENDPYFPDFLGETCRKWETEALHAKDTFRTVIIRVGLVLGKESGAFPKFEQPVAMGVVPTLGSGKQVMSWIEIDDLVGIYLHCLQNASLSGIFNAVAPHPVTQKELMQSIAHVKGGIRIPVWAPSFILRIMLGEMSVEILKSCRVSSKKIANTGFKFSYPKIDEAVSALLGK